MCNVLITKIWMHTVTDSAEGVVSLIPPSLPTPGRQHAKKEHTRKGKGRRKDKKHKGTGNEFNYSNKMKSNI